MPSVISPEFIRRKIRQFVVRQDLRLSTARECHVEGIYATQNNTNRIYLAGDAVHRHPATAGLGFNNPIGDAQNLCWKLAAVLNRQASPSLLSSYGAER